MFGFIADILTSITSILFPVFASYKALRSQDPANLAPWLMYWTTLSLFLLVENQLYFILYWIPFYSWIRFGIHLYLVLPGKQGSVFIYKEYIHPFLEEHERQIDHMISDAHAKAKAAGGDLVKQGWEYVRVQVFGQQAKQPSPVPSRNVSYSTYLMDRFAMPSARQGLATAGTSEIFNVLGKLVQQNVAAEPTSRAAKVEDLANTGTLIPPSLSEQERSDFIATNRDRLASLLQAFDREAEVEPAPRRADDGYGYSSGRSSTPRQPSSRKSHSYRDRDSLGVESSSHMHQSRSESEFEDLAYEPMPDPSDYRPSSKRGPSGGGRAASGGEGRGGGGGWTGWIWGDYPTEKDSAIGSRKNE